MPVETALPPDHPMMAAWNAFQATEEFMNALMWATRTQYADGRPIDDLWREQHVKGALWLAFTKGMETGPAPEDLKRVRQALGMLQIRAEETRLAILESIKEGISMNNMKYTPVGVALQQALRDAGEAIALLPEK